MKTSLHPALPALLTVLCLATAPAMGGELERPVASVQATGEGGAESSRPPRPGHELGLVGEIKPELLVRNGYKATWSPESDRLAFGREEGGIAILELSTRQIKHLTAQGKDPAWSPDGRYLAYVTEPGAEYVSEVTWLLPVAGGTPTRLGNGGLPAWSQDSQQVYFHDRQAGQIVAAQIAAPDKVPVTCFRHPRSWYPAFTPDGASIAFGAAEEMVVLDRTTGGPLFQLPMPGQRGALAGWSPDGRQLAFGGFASDALGLWILDLERRGAFQVATNAGCTMPAWSPDGQWLAFDHRGAHGRQIWRIATAQLPKEPTLLTRLPTRAPPQPNGRVVGPEHSLTGKPVPGAFKLPMLSGDDFEFPSAQNTNVLLLDFWATWCGPCRQVMPALAEISRDYAARGVRYVAVNLREEPEVIRRYLAAAKLEVEVAVDKDGSVAKAFQTRGIPMIVIVDRANIIRKVHVGASPRTAAELRHALEEVLSR